MEKRRAAEAVRPKVFTLILLIFFDVMNNSTDGLQVFDLVIRNFNAEFVLETHNQINNSERIRIQIVYEIGVLVNDGRIDAELISKELNYLFQNHKISS